MIPLTVGFSTHRTSHRNSITWSLEFDFQLGGWHPTVAVDVDKPWAISEELTIQPNKNECDTSIVHRLVISPVIVADHTWAFRQVGQPIKMNKPLSC